VTGGLTLRRLVWLLLIALILLTLGGVTLGDGWPKTWLPNYAAEAAGLLVTVIVVERVLKNELDSRRRTEEEPLRRSAQQRVGLALGPLFASLIHADVGPDVSSPFPQPISDPGEFLGTLEVKMATASPNNGTWIGSRLLNANEAQRFGRELEQAAARLQGALDRASRVLKPEQETVVEKFLIWLTTVEHRSPRSLAEMKAGLFDDAFASTIDEAMHSYFVAFFGHLRALVALHDELGPDRLSLDDQWSNASFMMELNRFIVDVATEPEQTLDEDDDNRA
jgi:hypothetical protein